MNGPDSEPISAAPDGRPMSAQPRWRKDFPIDWGRDQYVSRRDFAKFLVLTSMAFVVGQFWILAQHLVRRARGDLPALRVAAVEGLEIGGAIGFRYPENKTPRILVRLDERNFVAYEQQCTHLMCPVVPDVESGRLHCPCHKGYFDMRSGRPLAGPPRRPLERVTLEIRGNEIYAVGLERGSR